MDAVIRNRWQIAAVSSLERAEILRPESSPEGLHVARVRAPRQVAHLTPDPERAHLISILRGGARLRLTGRWLTFDVGSHLYLPPDAQAQLELEPGADLVKVSAPAEQAAGQQVLLRHETFVAAAAVPGHPLRWVLTPQYLSRRVFLRHDPILRSAGGHPVSWFRTTMFDVAGLPANADGEPVFKMSYDSRTEFNVLYDVHGEARVRMARHPYRAEGQQWGPWHALDGDTTYHLAEAAGGPEEERVTDASGRARTLRNRHEVYMAPGGHASLCCLFDPGPIGIERHLPGTYSDYEPFEVVSARPEYATHTAALARFDAMVDRLSMARAEGDLESTYGTPEWALYLEGQEAQRALEAALVAALEEEGQGRDAVVRGWTQAG